MIVGGRLHNVVLQLICFGATKRMQPGDVAQRCSRDNSALRFYVLEPASHAILPYVLRGEVCPTSTAMDHAIGACPARVLLA